MNRLLCAQTGRTDRREAAIYRNFVGFLGKRKDTFAGGVVMVLLGVDQIRQVVDNFGNYLVVRLYLRETCTNRFSMRNLVP